MNEIKGRGRPILGKGRFYPYRVHTTPEFAELIRGVTRKRAAQLNKALAQADVLEEAVALYMSKYGIEVAV